MKPHTPLLQRWLGDLALMRPCLPVPPAEELTGTHYLTLIVRLLLDSDGALLRGELTDAEGSTVKRFVGEDGLYEELASYLAANSRRGNGGESLL